MPDLTWKEAILQVLRDQTEAMHYTEIAEAIAERGLRSELGATPASSVAATLATSLQSEVVRVARGYYALQKGPEQPSLQPVPVSIEEADDTGLINAFGMYWSREFVLWGSAPRVLGQQQGGTPVDFSGERGVYLLHDGRAVVYVGRTTDQTLGVRLKQHTADRLNGRWDRFSWFGVYPVSESGQLDNSAVGTYDLDMLIVTMEALLIEGLEPPQNRKRGDDFKAVEFLQVQDPELHKTQIIQLIDDLKKRL
ncbi:MAG: hypothetical protein IPJ17_17080 [Holophagales bacterium]|nr:MAG: hypothetical protein IPJ17_17080 [Holophagales bacterium]